MARKYSKIPDYIIQDMVDQTGENKTKVKKTLKKAERLVKKEIEDLDPSKGDIARSKYLGNILTLTRDMLGMNESKSNKIKDMFVELNIT